MTNPKNIFSFAPKELSGSAFWAWVLYEAFETKNSKNSDAKALGKAFLPNEIIHSNDIKEVLTEHKVQSGRVDIALMGNKEPYNPVVLIENKHFSTPRALDVIKQVGRYDETEEHEVSPIKVIMTFRHDTELQWTKLSSTQREHCHFLSLGDQVELIKNNTKGACPIIRAYYEYISSVLDKRFERIEKLDKFSNLDDSIWHEDSLYELMTMLTAGIDKENALGNKLDLYIGKNPNGRPWVQAAFQESGKTFFYRLDKDSKGIYLRVNAYSTNPEDKTILAKSIKGHLKEAYTPFEWKESYLKGKESTLLKLYLNKVKGSETAIYKDIAHLRTDLAEFHKRFIDAVKAAMKGLKG